MNFHLVVQMSKFKLNFAEDTHLAHHHNGQNTLYPLGCSSPPTTPNKQWGMYQEGFHCNNQAYHHDPDFNHHQAFIHHQACHHHLDFKHRVFHTWEYLWGPYLHHNCWHHQITKKTRTTKVTIWAVMKIDPPTNMTIDMNLTMGHMALIGITRKMKVTTIIMRIVLIRIKDKEIIIGMIMIMIDTDIKKVTLS